MNEVKNEKDDSYRDRNRQFYGRIYPGVWMILIGVLLLLNNFGVLQGELWAKAWPVFIIVPGVVMLLRPRR